MGRVGVARQRLSQFKCSYGALQNFQGTWLQRIRERCMDQDQRKAAFFVWARYSMSINALNALLDPQLIPDLAVICRGCIEFDATLEAVMNDIKNAQDYLEFGKHAKARYLKILSKQGDLDRVLKRREQFENVFDAAPEDFGRLSWHAKLGGITGLMRSLGRDYEIRVYNVLSHFAHGSVSAVEMLAGGAVNPVETLPLLVDSAYAAYLDSSQHFVRFVWEPLTTREGERCKSDFVQVMSAHSDGAV